MESQIELRALRDCLEKWDKIISGIICEIQTLKERPKNGKRLQEIASELRRIFLEADAWGFDDLHHLSLRTQQTVLDLKVGTLPWDHRTLEYLKDALSMLSGMFPQCEKEYLRRLSTSNILRMFLPENDALTSGQNH